MEEKDQYGLRPLLQRLLSEKQGDRFVMIFHYLFQIVEVDGTPHNVFRSELMR